MHFLHYVLKHKTNPGTSKQHILYVALMRGGEKDIHKKTIVQEHVPVCWYNSLSLSLHLVQYSYIYSIMCTFTFWWSHLLEDLILASILLLFVSILPVSVHMILCVKRSSTGANKRFCTCLVHDGNVCP